MFQTKIGSIQKRKDKAMSVFLNTKEELMTLVRDSLVHQSENRAKIDELQSENNELDVHIKAMKCSVEKIEQLLG